jgi:hypothetical protein
MPRLRHLLPIFLLGLAACGPDPSALEADAVRALTAEIPALQARYFAEHGRYADHIRQLTGGADTLPSGIRVIIHGGGAAGWSATSSHREVPGAACAVFAGEPSRVASLTGNVGPGKPGEVSCIAFEPWMKQKIVERSGPFPLASTTGS